MEGLLQTSQLRIVALLSVVALGSSAGTHRSQDLTHLFRTEEARFVYGKIQLALPERDKPHAFQLTRTLLREAKKRNIDPLFLLALIEQESQFRAEMVGGAGEIGLMQIRPQTAHWIANKYGL